MHTVYTGERVRLRPFKSEDELLGHLEQGLGTDTWGPHRLDIAAERKRFQTMARLPFPGIGIFAVETLAGGLAGSVDYKTNPCGIVAGVGTAIEPAFRHARIGVEARLLSCSFMFENLPVGKIEAITLESNIAAITSLQRAGFKLEGARHGTWFSQGRWMAMLYFALFREEWEKMEFRHAVKRGN